MQPPATASALLTPEEVKQTQLSLHTLRDRLNQVLFGQTALVDLTVIALGARGHLLLEGLPGLGKTELCKALSALLGLSFRRIQFTPDLLPSDVTGGPVLQEKNGQRQFVFQPGPLFAHVVLADEINRASPKTQSALLEAMQEQRVTVLGETHPLPTPFFVLATQNPIEMEGTYPLPEAQLDRFLFKLEVPNVGEDVLTHIIRERRRGASPPLEPMFSVDSLIPVFAHIDRVFLPDLVARYIGRLVAATHGSTTTSMKLVKDHVKHGASPRAAIAMAESARVAALLHGRPNVDFADVQQVAPAALAHRLVLHHSARLSGVSAKQIVQQLLETLDPIGKELPGVVT